MYTDTDAMLRHILCGVFMRMCCGKTAVIEVGLAAGPAVRQTVGTGKHSPVHSHQLVCTWGDREEREMGYCERTETEVSGNP